MNRMKIAILGYGLEGRAAAKYYNSPDNKITICDQNDELIISEDLDKHLGLNYLNNLSDFDLIVRSPGLDTNLIFKANENLDPEKVTSLTNEFFKHCPTKNIIGVTGTKGKGTTSTLIHSMIEAAGLKSNLVGNIGTPAISILDKNIGIDDFVVFELSSFQLSDCRYSPHFAVCLMVTQDHLDWHGSQNEYVVAKKNIFSHQNKDDYAIYFVNNGVSEELARNSPGIKIPYFRSPGAYVQDGNIVIDNQILCSTNDVRLLGNHNLENVCAAITVFWQISKDKSAITKVLSEFTGLEHRLEFVGELNGRKFYNDSFASAPDAAIAGMKSIPGRKILIIGGFDRGLDLHPLIESLTAEDNKKLISKVLIIGDSSRRLASELDKVDFTNYEILSFKTMPEIVEYANKLAENDESIVLSPGFASFDMFKNFEERGNLFKKAVQGL
jgi:UDP-N-acetylmuramoylalanine--D-glutamate ligase